MLSKLLSALAALVSLVGPAAAYNVFSFGEDQVLKWGSNQVGSAGGIVTWSLMPDGTALDPLVSGFNWSGTSNLASVYAQVGGEAAATAGSAVVGHIRIGAFAFAPGDFTGAVGYAPPPNGGTTLEGDVIFNVHNRFGIPPGVEGAPYDLFPPPTFFYLKDFAGLAAHEIGHALGLAHSDVTSALMCGYVDGNFDGSQCHWADPDGNAQVPITRRPKPDGIAGIQHLYGVPEPGFVLSLAGGVVLLAGLHSRRLPDCR